MKREDYTLEDGTPWRLFTPENAKEGWVVLWLQGFTSTIEGHSGGCERMSQATSVPFVILNYAGHGNHPVELERATRRQQFEEVCAVYDELVNRGFMNVIVIGGSFGGYLAALLAGARSPRVLVLRAAANYQDQEFDYPYADTIESKEGEEKDLYRQSIDNSYSNQAVEGVRSFAGPTYVIEHGADTVISPNILQSYFHAAQRGNYIRVESLMHSQKLMPDPERWYKISERLIETIVYTVVEGDS